MTDKELLHGKLNSKISLPIGDVLSDSFELFGKGAGKYIGFTLLLFFTLIVLGMVTVVIPFLGVLLFILFALIASPALQVGFGRFTKKLKEDDSPQFSDFFSGFQFNLGQLVLQGFIISLITSAIAFGLNTDLYLSYYDMVMAFEGDYEDMLQQMVEINEMYGQTSVLSILGGLFSFYIGLGLSLTPYIVSFYKVNAITAMDVSFRTVNKVIGQALVINIGLTFIGVMGAVFFLIGLFATLPIMFIGSYLVFRYALGEKPSGKDEEWGVNKHLV